MKTIILYISILWLSTSCHTPTARQSEPSFRPAAGDLLFQINTESAMTEAITAATATGQPLPFSHVAIALGPHPAMPKTAETDSVIEATSHGGVRIVSLQDFLQASARISGAGNDTTSYGVVVMRLRDTLGLAHAATQRARLYLGQPYDYSYRPDNGKMYCSELVWESFRTPTGNHLFRARPMNFRDSTGVLPTFWQQLFDRLGEPVPEGVLGTNPAAMAQDTLLHEVYRYFH